MTPSTASPSLGWLASDLKQHASDGRAVVVFHHYGMDAFGTDGQWWSAADRFNYRSLLTGYHVSAVMTGHTHYAFGYGWDGLSVLQVTNDVSNCAGTLKCGPC